MKLLNEEGSSPFNDTIMYPRKIVGTFEEEHILKSAITAIALNERLDLYIGKKFSSKSSKYYKAACGHEWYGMTQSMCTADQIDRGIKVLGIWAVDGRKELDDLLKKGWPDLWKACERLRKERDLKTIQKHFDVDGPMYEICFKSVILLYYMYYFGMKDLKFPLAPADSFMDQEALFFLRGNIDLESKKDMEVTEEFCAVHGLFSDADNVGELMDLSEDVPDAVFSFFESSSITAGINPFCLMGHSLPKKEADILAFELKKIYPQIKGLSLDGALQVLYYAGYHLTVIGREYDVLKRRYFTSKKKVQKIMASKTGSNDEKKFQKELESSQMLFEKFKKENVRLREEIGKLEALKRKADAERDSEITKAVRENEKAFKSKETEYQDRIEMLEELLAEQIREDEDGHFAIEFKEMLDLIRKTSGILYICGNETSAGTKKIRKLRELADNIKFFSSENDPVPSDISYIFFDYHLISHGVYYKIKNIGKRNGIPIYNIENSAAEKNIAEIYSVIVKHV